MALVRAYLALHRTARRRRRRLVGPQRRPIRQCRRPEPDRALQDPGQEDGSYRSIAGATGNTPADPRLTEPVAVPPPSISDRRPRLARVDALPPLTMHEAVTRQVS